MSLSSKAISALMELFESNFRDRGELGVSVSVWQDGHELLSLGHGWCECEEPRPWTIDTLVTVCSSTKAPATATLLLALQHHGMNEQTLVRDVWPRFPVAEATFAHLFSHQCGLAALDERVDAPDHEAVVAAIETQSPCWSLGEGHGYHTRTFSALVDEPLRRLTGLPLGDFLSEVIAEMPRQNDTDARRHEGAGNHPRPSGNAAALPFWPELPTSRVSANLHDPTSPPSLVMDLENQSSPA